MTEQYTETQDKLFVHLKAGQYWRAIKNIKEFGVKKGTVLLLQSVRDIENEAHTVVVRPHPNAFAEANARYQGSSPCDYRFLVQDFLSQFELEPDYQRIRNEELALVQGKVAKLQKELASVGTDPTIMKEHIETGVSQWAKERKLLPEVAASLPNVPEPPEVIDQTLTVDKVERLKLTMAKSKVVAELQAGWIKEKVEAISKTVEAMTPYYQEQAQAALATTEDVRLHVAKLMTGIESLDLYVGTGVETRILKSGKDAAPEIPLTIMQQKLMMDEELSVWADIGTEFDFQNKELFYDALVQYPSLVKQIFPTERCIVCIATTDREIKYSDNPWVQAATEELNKNVFLLVRNGENIHIVYSPIESHTKSKRLFPSEQEMENIFTERDFNWKTHDYDRRPITFQSVQYTDKMTQFEAAAVHYKRFLILLAGLDHRLNMFGTFYNEPKGMNFMTLGFQRKYLKFIHDDDGQGLLPLQSLPDFNVWIDTRNAYLRSGSRVMCMWRDVMSPESAPACVEYSHGSSYNYSNRWKVDTLHRFNVVIAQREEQDIVVKARVKNNSWRSNREFLAKVNLTTFLKIRWEKATGFLVLDAVKADDLETYIHDRNSRKNFINYIRLFKEAIKVLREDEKREAPTRAALRQALTEGQIATGVQAEAYIDAAIIAWRSSHRGAPLTQPKGKEFRSLLDQMYTISRANEEWKEVEAFVKAMGRKPLRFVLSGTNETSVYTTPMEDEVDDILFPMAWVMNITLKKDSDGSFKEINRRWLRLPAFTAAETTLYEWPEAQAWRGRISPIEHLEEKKHLIDLVQNFERNNTLLHPMLPAIWDLMFTQYKVMRDEMSRAKKNRFVVNPSCYIPIGLEYHRQKNRLRIIAVGDEAQNLLFGNAPDKERKKKISEEYGNRYNIKRTLKEGDSEDKNHVVGLELDQKPEANGFTPYRAGRFSSFNPEEIKKTIKQIQDDSTFNNAPTKAFWIPSMKIDTTADVIAKKKEPLVVNISLTLRDLEGYHNDAGLCIRAQKCGCTGLTLRREL